MVQQTRDQTSTGSEQTNHGQRRLLFVVYWSCLSLQSFTAKLHMDIRLNYAAWLMHRLLKCSAQVINAPAMQQHGRRPAPDTPAGYAWHERCAMPEGASRGTYDPSGLVSSWPKGRQG